MLRVTCCALYLSMLSMLLNVTAANAHELPERVQTRILIEEGAEELTVYVRVPLEAMRDFDFPTRGQGYLDIVKAEPLLRDAAILWVADEFEVFRNGEVIELDPEIVVRVSLPADRSFDSVESVTSHMAANLGDETLLFWRQALLDIRMTFKIANSASLNSKDVDKVSYAIDSRLGHLGQRTSTSLIFVDSTGDEYFYDFAGSPGRLELAPDWYQVMTEFTKRGVIHIWEGIDHLVFLFCLILPIRQVRSLIWVVTAFTLGHSITLASAALGLIPDFLWFPAAIELLIALSIVVMALDNILSRRHEYRWLFGLCFGLIHGFGFSFTLVESLQFSGGHLLIALVGFNLGVEIGQLILLAIALPILGLIFRFLMADQQKLFVWVFSAIVAHSALHWTADQWQLLTGYF